MLTPPQELELDALVLALAGWGLREPRLHYLPVGFGGHHWRADDAQGRFFVTVDDLESGIQVGEEGGAAFDGLERAYRTAAALRDDAGLEFVLAPLAADDGAVVRPLSGRYAISVAPFVDGASGSFGEYETLEERERIGALLGRLHAASGIVDTGLPRRDDCGIPGRAALHEALATLDAAWDTGPFGEPARALLAPRATELEQRLRDYDLLAARVRERSGSWVITHGEPHPGNVLVEPDGARRLVDWDTTLVAPRERDLLFLLDDRQAGWDAYSSTAGAVELDREALDLYGRRWVLGDIGMYVAGVLRPHDEDENTAASFGFLRGYLERAAIGDAPWS